MRALVLLLLLAPMAARAQAVPPATPPTVIVAPPAPDLMTRVAANAAVYGSLYAVAFTLVQASSAAIVYVAPATALGATLTFGIPAIMVVAMANLVPVVIENVPGTVVEWMHGTALAPAAR